MSACSFPGCVALAVDSDSEQRCVVHRAPSAQARPCGDCRGTGSRYPGHLCERCGGTGYGRQKLAKSREVQP